MDGKVAEMRTLCGRNNPDKKDSAIAGKLYNCIMHAASGINLKNNAPRGLPLTLTTRDRVAKKISWEDPTRGNVDKSLASLLLIDDVRDISSMFLGEKVSLMVMPLTFGPNSATPPTL